MTDRFFRVPIQLPSDPTLPLHAVTMHYVTNAPVTIGSTVANPYGAAVTTLAGLVSVTSTTFVGALTGNASTATKLATPRNISFNGSATGSGAFDGSGDVAITLISATVTVPYGGTGLTSLTAGNYINAASGTTFQQRTPAQVLSDIGALAASGNAVSATTATNIAGGAAHSVPYQTGPNTTGFIAAINNGVFSTNASGVPAFSTTLPSGLTIANQVNSVSPAVSAAGTTQATGTALTGDYNVVSTVSAGTGVQLPTAVMGRSVTVENSGANPLLVYPFASQYIDGLAINLPVTIPVLGVMTFEAIATANTKWVSTLNESVNTSALVGYIALTQIANLAAQTLIGNPTSSIASPQAITLDSSLTLSAGGVLSVTAGGGGSGTVTAVTVTPGNGVSATVANQGTTPALTFTLGNITPTSVVIGGRLTASKTVLALTAADASQPAWGTIGILLNAQPGLNVTAITDTSTPASTVVAGPTVSSSFYGGSYSAANTGVTYTDAATVYIGNAPAAGTNVTITNAWALYTPASVFIGNNLVVGGTVSGAVGNFSNGTFNSGGAGNSLNVISSGSTATLTLTDTGINGVNLRLVGNGSTTPNKTIRVTGGSLNIVNSAYSSVIFSLDDTGDVTLSGNLSAVAGNFTGIVNATGLNVGNTSGNVFDIVTGSSSRIQMTQSGGGLLIGSVNVGNTAYAPLTIAASSVSFNGGLTAPGLTSTGSVVAAQNFIASTANFVAAPGPGTTGINGTIYLRPDGNASSVGQVIITNTGASFPGTLGVTGILTVSAVISANGGIATNGTMYSATATQIISPGPAFSGVAGAIYFRPDGLNSATGQVYISNGGVTMGAVSVASLTASSLINTAQTTSGVTIAASASATNAINVQSNSSSAAYFTFIRNGTYAFQFGMDTDNQLKVGGWSMGAVSYRLVHEGLTAVTLPGTLTAAGLITPNAVASSISDMSKHVSLYGVGASGYGLCVTGSQLNVNAGTGTIALNIGGTNYVNVTSAGISIPGSGRIVAGYDSGAANSVNCSGWFRTSGQTGFYCATYGGGIYMTDTTYVRAYNGTSMAAADFVISSDRRLKTGIRPLEYKGRLSPKSYAYIADGRSDIGFIAQDVEELYPSVVGLIEDTGMKQLSYGKLTAVLSSQLNALEDAHLVVVEELAQSKREVSILRDEMHELRALVHQLIVART